MSTITLGSPIDCLQEDTGFRVHGRVYLRIHPELGRGVSEKADLAGACGAVVAELCAIARRVEPVLKHIVRVRAVIPPNALLVLQPRPRAFLSRDVSTRG